MSRTNQLPNLDKLFKDDDEQDFTPLIGGSNLASLFSATNQKSTDISSPKPHAKQSTERSTGLTTASSNTTEVIIAKAIHAYKLQNGKYCSIGKLGIALTGNAFSKIYLLILYKNKQEHISVVTLTTDFNYSVRENNYATYYDGNNDNWSILFDSNDACIEFAREIFISKYFITKSKIETVFYQDLSVTNNEKKAKENDKIQLKYSIITNITQPLKINPATVQNTEVQITSDDNWEKSLIGISNNLKRILILPPSKQISLGPGFPRDKAVALDIEIIEIISPELIKNPSPNLPSGKASLISRMAKMGQSILPKMPTSTTTDSEDTDEEVQIKSPRRLRNVQLPAVHTASSIQQSTEAPAAVQTANILTQRNIITPSVASPHGALVPAAAFASTWTTTSSPIQQYITTADGQLYPIQQAVPQSMPTNADPNINVFLSETRTHNAEIRMGMSKIADNVQKLLDKFHVLELQNASSPINDKALETSLKMLLTLNDGKNERKTNDSHEIDRQLASNQFPEVNSSHDYIKQLEDELKETKLLSSDYLNKLERIENEKKDFNTQKLKLQSTILKLETSLDHTRNQLEKFFVDINSTNKLVINYQKDNAELQAKIITIDAEKKNLEKIAIAKDTTATVLHDKTVIIKQIMNKTYQTLIEKFTEDTYTTDHIKATIASTIKTITLQVLCEGRSDTVSNDTNDVDSKLSLENSNVEIVKENNIILPDFSGPIDFKIDQQDEPLPPIPPIGRS